MTAALLLAVSAAFASTAAGVRVTPPQSARVSYFWFNAPAVLASLRMPLETAATRTRVQHSCVGGCIGGLPAVLAECCARCDALTTNEVARRIFLYAFYCDRIRYE